MLITIPMNLETMQQLFINTLEDVGGPLLPEKNQKHEKIAKTLKNCLNS